MQFIYQFFRIFPTFYKDLIRISNSAHFTWRIYLSFFTSPFLHQYFFPINHYPLIRYMLRFEHCKSSVSLIFNKVFLKEEIIELCNKRMSIDLVSWMLDAIWLTSPDTGRIQMLSAHRKVNQSNQHTTAHPKNQVTFSVHYNTAMEWCNTGSRYVRVKLAGYQIQILQSSLHKKQITQNFMNYSKYLIET